MSIKLKIILFCLFQICFVKDVNFEFIMNFNLETKVDNSYELNFVDTIQFKNKYSISLNVKLMRKSCIFRDTIKIDY